ncbi:AbrB/MazE/SpoVT family DNA-binding domain-containing protein [Dehalococcoides mccartyi]|uniref:AbrB/MazE/SpoVT family DNA-binding domain-containing protein n=1 Tax=Dehalococcoides mccartyi TaxID=61435 RepID=UPI002FC60270
MAETSKYTISRKLLRSGNSLFVGVPSEVIEQWNLHKGDEVRLTVNGGTIQIQPNEPTQVENISEEMIETYATTMKGIQARVTKDTEAPAIHIEFSGENKKVLDMFVYNLWKNLPVMLRLLGLGSVEEMTGGEKMEPESGGSG